MKQFLRPVYYVPALIVLAIALIWSMGRSVVSDDIMISVPVEKGPFVAKVISTGQLQAENATSIEVPSALSGRSLGIYEIQVTDIVEEGTVVDSGDFVASLDHSAVDELMTEARDELEEALQGYEDAKIDTNINMSNLRDGLLDARVTVEEKKLVVEQSIYESPAVQRQANLDLERAQRDLEQSLRNYDLKKQQAAYDVQRAGEEVRKSRERIDEIETLFDALDVKAPKPGMVIYSYDRFGNKIQAGSTVSRWSPTIAQLPDLSSMISKTFINEIDISKIKPAQQARIGIDAFPEKSFDGQVVSVANIGQVLPEGDAKVFEVIIKLNSTDPDLRPAMTTSNQITTDSIPDAVFIPLEGVFKNDSLQYVFMSKDGEWTKQIIDSGAENANYVVVEKGLEPGMEIALTKPSNVEELSFEGLDIYEALKKEAEQEAKKEQEMKEKAKRKKPGMERGERPEGGMRGQDGRNGRRSQ
ncbi:efflux RND transporter periplasmic adaptor subunit [Marinilabilia rubra]|uniref:RND transporter n=1 Tax=Marinilabilia rubra TaxID=2162893 RepID=A0A2U2B384_9BACT|nr:HlyD family efflux transporter periplasmic adaptor subunit [Marinilabilia rubra]PWD97525.1 RND transporter [Marinilabilia rubra]